MPKKKSEPQKIKINVIPEIEPDIKRSILGIVLIVISIIFGLAAFKKAGPVGETLFNGFTYLLGVGYYLIPTILLVIGVSLLMADKKKIMTNVIIGGFLFFSSALSALDILSPKSGGVIGNLFGALEIPFGFYAALLINLAIVITGVILIINIPLKIRLKGNRNSEDIEEAAETVSVKIKDKNKEPEVVMGGEVVNLKKLVEEEEQQKNKKQSQNLNIKEADLGEKMEKRLEKKQSFRNYIPPSIDLLKTDVEKPSVGDLRANANIIQHTLESFGIPVEMGEITIGPKVTRYTLKPQEGIKLSRIVALNQDLSLALSAHPLRIEAPIPGKPAVGIEVPNKTPAIVRLGNLLNYPEFAAAGNLGFALGRGIAGEPIFPSIAKMPHMLVAGATGSGKSATIHSIIVSLLYKNSPETLKFIFVDPKRVELSIYKGIPHLIAPVITENKKAVSALRWAISEMDRRYDVLMKAGFREVKSYNDKNKEDQLPYIVIVIDEMADLMATYGREVEGSIVRLAQMARATGIHLVLSTQRPSVEVITGLIKANITTRIALQVASQIDSRTILDTTGAEKLLGGGDMLFVSADNSKPRRIQGGYVTDDEIKSVVEFIKENNEVEIEDTSVVEPTELEGILSSPTGNDDDDGDDLLQDAVEVVKEAGKASASLLQRRLKVGYARAARLLDIMESKGIIGPGDGAKPREVYINQSSGQNMEEDE